MATGKSTVLKLRRRHPAKQMRLGRHLVTPKFQEYELNEKEQKSLQGKGPKHWIISEEEFKKLRQEKADKSAKKAGKKDPETPGSKDPKKVTKKVAKKTASKKTTKKKVVKKVVGK